MSLVLRMVQENSEKYEGKFPEMCVESVAKIWALRNVSIICSEKLVKEKNKNQYSRIYFLYGLVNGRRFENYTTLH